MRAPQRWEPLSAWLCAPHPSQPRVAWPPASSVWKGGLGTELHMGKLLQKTQQCFWTTSSCHRLWRLQRGWGGRETEAGCSGNTKELIFCTALTEGERGGHKLCSQNRSPSCSACCGWESNHRRPQAEQSLALELRHIPERNEGSLCTCSGVCVWACVCVWTYLVSVWKAMRGQCSACTRGQCVSQPVC